jgi:HAD superfamily hydrolase (TIGR01484 family)
MTPPPRFPATKISAVVSDVDGTLLTKEKVLTPRSKAAAAELRLRGIIFAIISSRPSRGLSMLLGPLGITTPVGSFNGGVISRPDLTLITEHFLSPDVARRAVAMLDEHELQCWVFSGPEWLVRDPDGPYVEFEDGAIRAEDRRGFRGCT